MVISILIGSFALLLIIGVPISFSIGLSGILSIIYIGTPLPVIAQKFISGIDSFSLIAIPLFILAGNLMNSGGIAKRLIDFASCLVGFIRGGLAMVNIVASIFFGGISGSSVADSTAIGAALIPAMKEKKYTAEFSAAVTSASSTIGVIIPPSIPMILYGVMAGVSIKQLFIAGIIPGILIALSLMLATYLMALKYPETFPKEQFPTISRVWSSFKKGIFSLLMPIIVLGGIILGIVTATEAALIAVVYALLIGGLVHRELKVSQFKEIIHETISGTSTVMFLVGAASLFGFVISYERIPAMIGNAIQSFSSNYFIILLLILALLLVVGLFMDLTASLIILTPILLPIVSSIGVDPVHFGIILVVALAIGLTTPPVGLCLFISSKIANTTILKTSKSSLPLLGALFAVLLLITFIPTSYMWLLNFFD